MKNICLFLFVPLLMSFSGCPQLDEEEVTPELEIWQNIPGGRDTEVRVLDIDPGPEGKVVVYLKDPATNVQIPGNFSGGSGSVSVVREDVEFAITGLAGGTGIITFSNRIGTKEATLYVFVRNWKRADVFRHTLDPDPFNYPLIVAEHNAKFNVGGGLGGFDNYVGQTAPYQASTWAVYKSIVDRGFFYEAPDNVAGQSGYQVDADRTNANWNRDVHNEPHILYYPHGEYPYSPEDRTWKESFLRKPVFAFVVHYEYDGDMVGGYPDRQRLELKTMNNTTPPAPYNQGPGDIMFSNGGGDIFTHRWKFKLPVDLRVSTEYLHIHQIKPEGADNGNPTFTLTCRKKSNGDEVMQLIYRGPIREVIGDREIPSANWYPSEVPLEPFRGEWIRAEETVTYDSPGAYKIRLIRIRDMRVLLEWEYNPATYEEEDPFVMFRKGNTYVRQKNGVYRRIMHMTPFGLPNPADPVLEYFEEGNEVRVLFTDFEMDKWKN